MSGALTRGGRSSAHTDASVPRSRPTAVELVGVLGVLAGFGLLVGPIGAGVGVVVVALWYAFSGVYGFAAGQFMLAVAMPARLSWELVTPEFVAAEAALVLLLVGADHRSRWQPNRLRSVVTTLASAVVVTGLAVGVGVGSAPVVDDRLVVAVVAGTFVLGALVLFGSGRAVVSVSTAEEPDA